MTSKQTEISVAGNAALLRELRQMKQKAHLPHALLLHGAKGCGKKRIAQWFTQLVLCEQEQDAPCGKCKNCRLVAEFAHPDVKYAEHSGKRAGFSVETARAIRKEAAILPNNGAMRVFLFPDADGMSIPAQNALLKSVEEPPSHACFVFTTETVGAFLPTLLSRMTIQAVFPVTPEECQAVLQERAYTAEQIQSAVARFGGNIGKCIDYLEDLNLREATDTAAALTAALARKDEYELLRLLTAAASDKNGLKRTLELLDMQIRDAAVLMVHAESTRLGCDSQTAKMLAERLTPRRAMQLHSAISEAFSDLDGNVGAVLTVTALCATMLRFAGE